MNINTIKKIAKKADVRVSTHKEDKKRVIGLHGFLSDIQVVVKQITGYWIEQTNTGYYLYSNRANWTA